MQEVQPRREVLTAPPAPRWPAMVEWLRPTLRYWMETEVHVYAFSIAANVLLSFFPFMIVILSLCRHVLGWEGAVSAIDLMLDDYFPGQVADRGTMLGFIHHNLRVAVLSRGALQAVSALLLLFTANGIFEPLEVALNRVWGIKTNRSFLKNQMVSLGLIFACGSLALVSTVLTGVNARLLAGGAGLTQWLAPVFFKMAAMPISILMLFLIYWLLPNAKIAAAKVLPAAIFVGLGLEGLKYLNLVVWPLWYHKVHAEYGPFTYSVTIILWSFLAAMLMLAGAEWAARSARETSAAAAAEAIAPADR